MRIKHCFIAYALCIGTFTLSANLWADDEPNHYQGASSASLEQALANLSAYNKKLTQVINKKPLSGDDINAVHQLTYTLENALIKIATEIQSTQVALEALHKASEVHATEKVKTLGAEYLKKSQPLAQ